MQKMRSLAVIVTLFFTFTACKKEVDNKLPTADAGPSQAVTLPSEGVTLSGSAIDPDGKIVTYIWAQVSGPSAAVIVDPGAPSTVVQGLVKGTYVFQLSAWDNLGGIGTDTTSITVNGTAANTLTLQPVNNPNEFSLCERGGQDVSNVSIDAIGVWSWTYFGASYTLRQLLKFDLSSIPSSATINSAHLYLYSDSTPVSGNQHDANSGDNAFTVQQVATDWQPVNGVTTWFNQPAGLTSNQVSIPSTTQPFLDMDIDVTAQVGPMVNQNKNYGFLIKLVTEQIYAARQFVGSHMTARSVNTYPKLVVQYN